MIVGLRFLIHTVALARYQKLLTDGKPFKRFPIISHFHAPR